MAADGRALDSPWPAGRAALSRSTIGRKIVMALTGLILVGYLVVHVAGNLLVFQGADSINNYAEFLKGSGALVWSVRAILLAALVLHVHAAWTLSRLARSSRATRYDRYERLASTWSSRSMRVGGVLLLIFVVYHILHYTTGTVHPSFDRLDVFGNVLVGFSVPWVAAFYVISMIALGLHLDHGLWSMLQTLGASHPRYNRARRRLATVLAIAIAGGFASIPLAVAFGLVR